MRAFNLHSKQRVRGTVFSFVIMAIDCEIGESGESELANDSEHANSTDASPPVADSGHCSVSCFGLGRTIPPSPTQLHDIPDTLRANAAIAHLAGLCARACQSEASCDVRVGPPVVTSHAFANWATDYLPGMPIDAVRSLLPRLQCVTHMDSGASELVKRLLATGAVVRTVAGESDSRSKEPTFLLKAGDGDLRKVRTQQCAHEIVKTFSQGIDISLSKQTEAIVREAYTVIEAAPSEIDGIGGSSGIWEDAGDFVDAWLTDLAVRTTASIAAMEFEEVTIAPHAAAFARFEALAPGSLIDKRLVLLTCREWISHNWHVNLERQSDERAMRVHRTVFGTAPPTLDAATPVQEGVCGRGRGRGRGRGGGREVARRTDSKTEDHSKSSGCRGHFLEQIRAEDNAVATSQTYALEFASMSQAQKVFAVDLVGPIEGALACLTTTHPVYGRPPISSSRSMNGWLRRQGDEADSARRAFVDSARTCMRERGAADLLDAAVRGISSNSNHAVVSFGQPMFDAATSAIRARDAHDLLMCSDGNAHIMVLLATGMLATAFANVIPWRGSTRAKPVYAVYRQGEGATFGGWQPATHSEIATVYVTAAISALDGLRDSDCVDEHWRVRHKCAWFASQVGDASTRIASGLETALLRRWFLAGNGARLQELDPAKELPIERARALLSQEYYCQDGQRDDQRDDHDSDDDGRSKRSDDRLHGESDGWTSRSAQDAGEGQDAWGAEVSSTKVEAGGLCKEDTDDRVSMTVTSDPRLDVMVSHLRAMGLLSDDAPAPRGFGVFVKCASGGGWSVLAPAPSDRGSVYIEDVHSLASVPWPGADTFAAFVASVYGPSGEPWEAIIVVGPDNCFVEGPHVRSQIRGLYPHIRRLPFRHPRRHSHALLRTLPRIMAPIIATGSPANRTRAVLLRMHDLAMTNGNVAKDNGERRPQNVSIGEPIALSTVPSVGTLCGSGSGSIEVGFRNGRSEDGIIAASGAHIDDVEIVSHERGSCRSGALRIGGTSGVSCEDGSAHRAYTYVAADGRRITLPSGEWGAYCAIDPPSIELLADSHRARVRSRVREYWAKVPVDTLDEFLDAPQLAHGRMTPHDAPKRLVRPRVFVMMTDERSRTMTFRETALDRVRAVLAWDRSAHLVDERNDCFVYLLTNTLDPRFPLIVVAGLVLNPFLPSSAHELISREWLLRGEMCPHIARSSTEYHDAEDTVAVDAYMQAANDMPAEEAQLAKWFSELNA